MQSIKEKLLNLIKMNTIRNKLLFTIIACTAVPILISMGHIMYTSLDIVEEQTIQSERYNLELANLALSNDVDDMIQMMNYIHFDQEIRSTLNRSRNEPIPPRAFVDINSTLDQLTRNSDISVAVIPAVGDRFFSNYNFHGPIVKENITDWLESLENISTFQVYGFNAEEISRGNSEGHLLNNNELSLVLGKRLTNYTGETTAYIFAGLSNLNVEYLENQFQSSRNLALVDENGFILYDQNESNIGLSLPHFEQIDDTQDFMSVSQDGEDYLYLHHPFPFQGWTLVSYTPYNEAMNELDNAFTQVILIFTIALILLIIILLFIVNRYTQPITSLANAAREIEAGNLQIRSNFKKDDEIGRLSQAFDLMLDRIQGMFKTLKAEQEIKRKAEIAHLQDKIKPHFIFNVLNTIRIQSYQNGDKQSSELILSFNKFLRMIYKGDEYIALEEEINHAENYVYLMNSMRKTPVKLEIDIAPETLNKVVPRFCIQPIVENSLKHGIKNGNGVISIYAGMENEQIKITVKDNGTGIEKEKLQLLQSDVRTSKEDVIADYNSEIEEASGIGLKNVYERMRLTYGEAFSMEVDSELDRGVSVIFRFYTEEEKR
ncbi:sensor histidine kinase [Alkalicoccus daliensis]|uniref:Two-component system, sensor histidine kinase YesM n=1 Tax=Alkalicoccus daliensis TaxID=745820 RepID=A0A1H0GA92_9BACI|nr:sensor histidine kinase [Alkalicoccus daliensis]SDO03796.1 two-component system, sensor histidine kinase YesM [Alkalicoccus daliensis]